MENRKFEMVSVLNENIPETSFGKLVYDLTGYKYFPVYEVEEMKYILKCINTNKCLTMVQVIEQLPHKENDEIRQIVSNLVDMKLCEINKYDSDGNPSKYGHLYNKPITSIFIRELLNDSSVERKI